MVREGRVVLNGDGAPPVGWLTVDALGPADEGGEVGAITTELAVIGLAVLGGIGVGLDVFGELVVPVLGVLVVVEGFEFGGVDDVVDVGSVVTVVGSVVVGADGRSNVQVDSFQTHPNVSAISRSPQK
jgi:hypothetical protein